MPEREYHSHKALSSTGARLILESPARFLYQQTHPRAPRAEFDLGTAVHTKVLGTGSQVEVLDFPDWRTKAAQTARDDVRAEGRIPMLQREYAPVNHMSEAVLSHPKARELFEQSGNAEASVFATDPATGVDVRARFDFLPDFTVADPWAVDLKTARDASPDGFARSCADYRYDIQQEWYDLTHTLSTGAYVPMKFVAVEKEPPYLVGVYELAREFAELGRKKVREALETYARCVESGEWPGYPTDIDPLQPPSWLFFSEGDIE